MKSFGAKRREGRGLVEARKERFMLCRQKAKGRKKSISKNAPLHASIKKGRSTTKLEYKI